MIRSIRSAAIFLAAALFFASMASSCSGLVKLKYQDGKYVDSRNGISYISAPVCFEPESVGAEYAEYDKTVLHEIGGLDPREWLTETYEGIGSVYYSDKIELPTLETFGAKSAYICIADAITIQMGEIDSADDVREIIDLFSRGEEVALPVDGTASYHIKFVSDDWPSIFYDVLYVEHDSQHNYLYDRSTKRCVDIGRALKQYLPSDEDLITA